MMSAFTSPPSPLLDVSSSPSSAPSSAFLVGWHIASTFPCRLWNAYVAYLWNHQPSSWIGRLASTFRILAVIIILPVVLLTLLDVTSYVIARTLGIVEDLKASTSDADARHASEARSKIGPALVPVPTATATCACSSPFSSSSATTSSLLSHGTAVDGSGPVRASDGTGERPSERDKHGGPHGCASATDAVERQVGHAETGAAPDTSSRTYSFIGAADGRLAGEGVFSPVASVPGSPLTPRVPLRAAAESDGGDVGQASEEAVLRRRVQGVDARADRRLDHA